jgi:hypothetical protein
MNIIRKAFLLSLVPLIAAAGASAQSGHYIPGSRGMNTADLPQYRVSSFRSVTGLYFSSKYARDDGSTGSINADIEVVFGELQYRFMSGRRLLGANLGFALSFNYGEADFNTNNPDIQDGPIGVGDPGVTPLIMGWDAGRIKAMFEYRFFIPVGQYDEDAADNVGRGFWSHLFSAGATGYAGADSSWSGTLVARYEYNSQMKDRDIKPGDDVIVEASFGKRLWGVIDAGAMWYGAWQVTDNSGSAVKDEMVEQRSSVMAAGIELAVVVPDQPVEIRWRSYGQFSARNRLTGPETFLEFYFYF